jgi:AI-2 transport protein TqsA
VPEAKQLLKFNPNRLAVWSIILAVLVTFLVVAQSLLIPLVIAFLLWTLLDSIRLLLISKAHGKIPMPRGVATAIAIVIIFIAIYLIASILTGQLDALSQALPAYHEKLAAMLAQLGQLLGIEELPSAANVLEKLDVSAALGWAGNTLGGLFGNLALIAVYLGFILVEEKIFPDKLKHISQDPKTSAQMTQLAGEINTRIQQYIGMKTAISLLTGVLSYLLLRFMDVDFAALWSLLIFLLNFIPNIGSILGMLLPGLMTLFQFDSTTPFFIVVAGLGAINFIVGNILEPAYMGRSLNLSPLMILFSLSIWGAIWGLAGMFLSVPLMVVTAIICSHFRGLRWIAVLLSETGRLNTTAVDE